MVSEKHLWILEDDAGARFIYEECLGIRYAIDFFETLTALNDAISDKNKKRPDLLIADLRLGDGLFLRFMHEHAEQLKKTPCIIISSVNDVDALRFCFAHGVHDYIIKPFQKGELIAKLEKALNTPRPQTAINTLTETEQKILKLFQQTPAREITRDELLANVWPGISVNRKTIDVHLSNIRQKIQPLGLAIQAKEPGRWTLSSDRVNLREA
jgi:DNA-binding response OmpR family regulator